MSSNMRRSVVRIFQGRFDAALVAVRECADKYAPWMETNEFCDEVVNGHFIEAMRGRATESWSWIVRAVDRLRLGHVHFESDFLVNNAGQLAIGSCILLPVHLL